MNRDKNTHPLRFPRSLRRVPGKRGEMKKLQDGARALTPWAQDGYATVGSVGCPIQVLKDYTETMNRYAFLLVE